MPFIETVEPSGVPTMRVRDLEADEEYVMSAFERHADHCSHCANPLQVHRDEDSLCERGQQYAVDVAKYLYSENGKAKSVIDRDLDQPTLVKIPRNCSAVRGLLLAVEDGLRLPRKEPVKPVVITYPAVPRPTAVDRPVKVNEIIEREPRSQSPDRRRVIIYQSPRGSPRGSPTRNPTVRGSLYVSDVSDRVQRFKESSRIHRPAGYNR